jgi:molybdopterin-guanine dinucleotide biosynthesis protein A
MSPSFGAVILCGGQSRRMGKPKAWLPIGDEMMLQRVVRIVREAISGPIIAVAAADQSLPPLPADVVITHDDRPDRGPSEGLAAGFKKLIQITADEKPCEAAFVTSCDVALLRPAFVRCVCESLGDFDAAVPQIDGRVHPLGAAYRVATVLPEIATLLATDQLAVRSLFERIRTRYLSDAELRMIDPQLDSFRNINTPEDYEAALRELNNPG